MTNSEAFGPRRQSRRRSRQSAPGAASGPTPGGGRSSDPGNALHVSQDDELSDSHSQPTTPRGQPQPNPAPAPAVSQVQTALTEAQAPQAEQLAALFSQWSRRQSQTPDAGDARDLGLPTIQPPPTTLEHRMAPNITETQLSAIMASQSFSGTERRTPTRAPFQPVFTRQHVPLTSIGAAGARPQTQYTLPQPPLAFNPMNMVQEAIALAQQQRDQTASSRA